MKQRKRETINKNRRMIKESVPALKMIRAERLNPSSDFIRPFRKCAVRVQCQKLIDNGFREIASSLLNKAIKAGL
ncbi:hypothetical protein J5X91_17350 [Pseudoalteromonas sp. K222D]|uniref:hypothetical protein n=1 Tax=Pseudoalteromonas sp. K222D TaxID=2820756 RepID=UPI001AD76C21|nr:hypothetical protein [Pseudoalteromonas sp. K222D]MBO7928010.1 hypothetical protein [Pseudoalteromonas sp. K222D]